MLTHSHVAFLGVTLLGVLLVTGGLLYVLEEKEETEPVMDTQLSSQASAGCDVARWSKEVSALLQRAGIEITAKQFAAVPAGEVSYGWWLPSQEALAPCAVRATIVSTAQAKELLSTHNKVLSLQKKLESAGWQSDLVLDIPPSSDTETDISLALAQADAPLSGETVFVMWSQHGERLSLLTIGRQVRPERPFGETDHELQCPCTEELYVYYTGATALSELLPSEEWPHR